MDTQNKLLERVDEVISNGPYCADWESLAAHCTPAWYTNAKFGIFIHWGVYSVPAFGKEWYPRDMYIEGSPEYEHHKAVYGDQKNFGYKDFIPMFKAKKFDANAWVRLFKQAGARFVMPVSEHHDGFQMYKSSLSKWNSWEMGPRRDVLGELKAASERHDLVFTLSNHRAEHCWFFNGGLNGDTDITDPDYLDFYGEQIETTVDMTQDIFAPEVPSEHLDDWLARQCELVDAYRPRIVWFDWWIFNIYFRPYLKKFAAFYYNRGVQWNVDVAINYKFGAFPPDVAVLDVERGQMKSIRPRLWQTDTAIAKNSWCYTHNNDFKSANEIVCSLVDIVSKNGCLLLNVGPRADGTITDEETGVLIKIGQWLDIYGEGIYDSTYWECFGEGPTQISSGAFSDTLHESLTARDIRFTYKTSCIYAFVMKYPDDGKVTIKSLARNNGWDDDYYITKVSQLGFDNDIAFTHDTQGLNLSLCGNPLSGYPVCLKIEMD